MKRKLPPFAAIKAFEATARHKSMKLAAEELCLSPSAVSHQIKALETFLNTDLLVRRHNALELTLTGRAYCGKLTTLLDGSTIRPGRQLAVSGIYGCFARLASPLAGWFPDSLVSGLQS